LKESNARLGAEVILKTTDEAVTVTQPDGTVKSFKKTGGELALETPFAGIYSVAVGTVTNQFSVNALAADESNISRAMSQQWGRWGDETERRMEDTSAVWLLGLLALALLTVHLYLLKTLKGGS
jgi:hypothetical protein